jgi:hypothetical protein
LSFPSILFLLNIQTRTSIEVIPHHPFIFLEYWKSNALLDIPIPPSSSKLPSTKGVLSRRIHPRKSDQVGGVREEVEVESFDEIDEGRLSVNGIAAENKEDRPLDQDIPEGITEGSASKVRFAE